MADALSPRLLARAPHRLMFFIGASNVLLAMLWWAAWLASSATGRFAMPQPQPYAGWLHAFVMQYQMLASFVFGFLLTVFPRWMGLHEFERWRYAPVGVGLFGGQIATLLGAMGWHAGIVVGVFMTLGGWIAAMVTLAPLLWRERGTTWHARSCFAALSLGLLGLVAWAAFVLGARPIWAFASIKLGSFGLLLPMYLTVAHRMFPFFAGNVVPGYTPWRPLWILGALWALALLHLGMELTHAYGWLWLADVPLFVLAGTLCVRWWPSGPKPALLTVLFLGLAWLPIAFLLYATQSLAYLLTGIYQLGRAPAHALFVGFFGSVLVAMVTRVTQGHSGRALVMTPTAWFAFVAIQLVALLRVGAEFAADGMRWQAIAAIGWLVALLPWVARLGGIYLSPRKDGKPG
ncbi:NnrS family protein [Lysobacter solisilvae (ex Woo and Kim 2020)]|uniref:NnrS family protein n=1 Tax=Agrilutibacter terrestris TaxID=2865112 RepID=A0A7H0FWL2_9GAMM|nr:NnrS family protein [Lysobacter terrestris]QNP40428.1 NnrS family protein [Lysobacter terrestris]